MAEPYFEIRCNECGTTFHAGDGDGWCPNCDATSVSYDATAAREWTEWRDRRLAFDDELPAPPETLPIIEHEPEHIPEIPPDLKAAFDEDRPPTGLYVNP